MARKNRNTEENARRVKIRGLLQISNIWKMDGIQNLFKEAIADLKVHRLIYTTNAIEGFNR